MIYLDSSALVKLAVTEPESPGLLRWLAAQPNLVRVASTLIRVEVPRAVWRAEPSDLPESYLVIRRTAEIELTDEVLSKAAGVKPVTLRAIDAIHLASALGCGASSRRSFPTTSACSRPRKRLGCPPPAQPDPGHEHSGPGGQGRGRDQQ